MIKEFGHGVTITVSQEREHHHDCPPQFVSAVTIVVLCCWLTLSDSLFCVQSLGWKESVWWCRNNVITTDRFSYEPSAFIDCAPHTHKLDDHAQRVVNQMSLLFLLSCFCGGEGDLWALLFFLGDAFPAGSSPFLSGYPGPSPLTSDHAYRSANPSSLQMAQLWASHAHDGKSVNKLM